MSDELPDKPADPSLEPPMDPRMAWTMRLTMPATADEMTFPMKEKESDPCGCGMKFNE